jgi:hypothetical protein
MARVAAETLQELAAGPVVGKIPVVQDEDGDRVVRLIGWQDASRRHSRAKGETADRWNLPGSAQVDVTRDIIDTLPPDVHIPHRERYQQLCRQLLQDGLAFYRQYGYIRWPTSVEAELRTLGFRLSGYRLGLPDLAEQVEALAAYYITRAANEQKEQDQKKVTLDHRGRYSA